MAGWFGYDLWSNAPSEEERATIEDERPKDENWIWVDNEGDHLHQNDVELLETDELKREQLMSYADAVRASTERRKHASNDGREVNNEESVEKNKNQPGARKQSQKNENEYESDNEDKNINKECVQKSTRPDRKRKYSDRYRPFPILGRTTDIEETNMTKWVFERQLTWFGHKKLALPASTTNEVAVHHPNVCLTVPDRYAWKIVGGKEKRLSKMQKDQANFRAGQFVIDVSGNNGVLSLLRVGSCDTTIRAKTSQKLVELCTVVHDVKLTRKAGKCKIIDLEEAEFDELRQGIKYGPLTKEQTKRVEKMACSETKKREIVQEFDNGDQEFTIIKTYGPLTKEQTVKLKEKVNFSEGAGKYGTKGQSGTNDSYMRQFQEGIEYGPPTKEAMKSKKIRKNTKNRSGKQRRISYEDKATQCCIVESRVAIKPELRIVVESQPLKYLLRIEQQPLSIEWYKEDMTKPSTKSIFNGLKFMESVFLSLMSLAISMTKIDIVSLEDFQNYDNDIAETKTTAVGKCRPKRCFGGRERRDEEVEMPPVRRERMFQKKRYKKKVLKCGNKTVFKKGASNNKNRNFTPQKFSGRGGARAC